MTEEQRLAKNATIKEAMKATHEKRKSQVCRVYMLKVQKNKRFGLIYIQDENLMGWRKNGHGKAVQHSCLGRVKARLKSQDNVYVVNRWEPTTQKCINCGKKHPMPQNVRTYKCDCGLCMPRDLHSANRMVQEGRKLVPPEQREFMSVDWESSIVPYLGHDKSPGMKHEAHRL